MKLNLLFLVSMTLFAKLSNCFAHLISILTNRLSWQPGGFFPLQGFRKQAVSCSLMLALLVPITLLPIISFGGVPKPVKSKVPDKQPAAAQSAPQIFILPGVQSLPENDGGDVSSFERYAADGLNQPTAPLLSGDLTNGFYSLLNRDVLPSSMKSYVAMADECPTGFRSMGGSFMSDPTASMFKGKVYVFARGANSELFYRVLEKGVRGEWKSLGGKLVSNPASYFNATTLFVEATGPDGARYNRTTTDGVTFTEWAKGSVNAFTTTPSTSLRGITYTFKQGNGITPPICLQVKRPGARRNGANGQRTTQADSQTSAKSGGAQTNSTGPILNRPPDPCEPWYPGCDDPPPPPSGDQSSPIGVFDGIDTNNNYMWGWSFDPDNPSASNDVHIYIGGQAGGGGIGFAMTANQSRPDVNNAYGISGDHGFSFQIPAQFADGQQHQVYAYGIDTGANGPTILTNSPLYFTKNPPPPDTPSWGVIYSVSQTQLDVYWNAVPNATSYHFAMDGNIVAYNFGGTAFAMTGLAPGSTHTFTVQAVNQWGVSNWSAPLSQTTQPPLMPAVPTWGVVNTISQSQLDLHWNAAANSTGYNVRMDGNVILNNFGGVDYAAQGLAPASTHTFEIQGVNQYGVSAWSDSRSGTTLAPPTPTPTPTPPPPTPTPPPTPPGTINTSRARLSPKNATGETDLYSRNFNWRNGLVSLPGRSLNTGFDLSYNSLIWVKNGSDIVFNPDKDNVTPGFRFGYPVIEPAYADSLTGKNTYLMVSSSGGRTEFRQVDGTTDTFETADSSYLQIKVIDANNLVMFGTDGSQSLYTLKNGAFRCAQIKDANGNYVTVATDANGLLQSVTDTLGRVINVTYDGGGQPSTITQQWQNGTHTYATFSYANQTISANFSGLNQVGIANGTSLKVLQRITYADGSFVQFDYNAYGQVWKVSNYAADNHLLNYSATNLNTVSGVAQADCPRYTEFHNWAQNFNTDSSNQAQEIVIPVNYQENQTVTLPDNSQAAVTKVAVTAPDGTISNTYYGNSGWMEGIPLVTEDFANESGTYNRKRWTWTGYAQDNTALAYILNPRTVESKIGDGANVKRTTIEYHMQAGNPAASQWGLVKEVVQYDANGVTPLKRSHTEYNFDTQYTSRRIIGLPADSTLSDENNTLLSRVTYVYDNENGFSGAGQNISPIQHDTNYGSGFPYRGNLTSTTRWDITNPTNGSSAVTNQLRHDTAGSSVAKIDPLGRTVSINYADSFDDNQNHNTYAYPTTITDPAGFTSTIKYRYDFGVNVHGTSPAPLNNSVGKTTSRIYDSIGRLQKDTIENTGAYTRYEYALDGILSKSFTTITDINSNGADAADEIETDTIIDGGGRTIGSRTELPNSTGGFSATLTRYDNMSRVKSQSVPTEVNVSWQPAGDDAARGFLWTTNDYDWKGRTIKVTNTDGTDKLMSYEGCGCAGGQVTTLSGEQLAEGRRRQKIYEDILGRSYKTETLNWDGSVYTTMRTTFNGRDQATLTRQYQGADTSNTYQDTVMIYDGHGRLKNRHRPEQDTNNATTFNYNPDDTIQSQIDARGAAANYTYNSRKLVEQINYSAPNGSNIPITPSVSFSYDNMGNRVSMTDGTGTTNYSYDQLSQISGEVRQYNDIQSASYPISYNYTLSGSLKNFTDPSGTTLNYQRDSIGRINKVTTAGNAALDAGTIVDEVTYRAWGALKKVKNGTAHEINYNYNDRLQVARAFLSDPLGRKWWSESIPDQYDALYSYYADGKIKRMTTDQSPSIFADYPIDSEYRYDQAGRLSYYDQQPQRDGNGNIITHGVAYVRSYQYNAFDNTTNLSGIYWHNTLPTTASVYTNNRNTANTYDAEGHIIVQNNSPNDTNNTTIVYDAAGRPIESIYGNNLSHTLFRYDGNGRLAKETTTNQQNITTTNFRLFSNVIGAQIMTLTPDSYNSDLPAVGDVTYSQGDLWSTRPVHGGWHFSVPVTKGEVSLTNVRGNSYTQPHDMPWVAEYDPLGTSISMKDPTIPPPPEDPNPTPTDPTFVDFGEATNPGTGCFLDGAGTSCSEVLKRLNSGSAIPKELERLQSNPQFSFESTGLGTYRAFIPGSNNNNPEPDNSETLKVSTTGTEDRWETYYFNASWEQTRPIDVPRILDGVKLVMATNACKVIIQGLLNAVATKNNPLLENGDIVKLSQMLPNQKGGGFTRIKPSGSAGYGSGTGLFKNKNASVFLGTTNNNDLRNQLFQDIQATVDELMHLSGKNAIYSDREFADVVHKNPLWANSNGNIPPNFLPRVYPLDMTNLSKQRKDDLKNNSGDELWSGYWHNVVYNLCSNSVNLKSIQ